MLREIITPILIPAFLMQAAGCYTSSIVAKENLNSLEKEKIIAVTNDGKEYEGKPNHWYIKNDTLVLGNYNFSERKVIQQKIPFTLIKEVYADKYSSERTILLLCPLIAAAFSILIFYGVYNKSY